LKVFEKHLVKFAFSNVDGFIVQAEELVQSLGRLKPGANVKKVFHPLYDFYQNWDMGFIPKKESDVPVLLFFGKIRKYKGLETLLKALAEVKKRMKFQAVIAGEFYVSSSKYKRLARSLGLMDQINWLDHYIPNDQVPGLFRNADLVVLPYQNATQSGVVPVAYQFDVPVIATRVGGLSEVIQDNATGFLVPPGNAIALAEKILEYFETSRKLEFQNNIRSFRERLSWSQAAENLVELVTELKGSDSL
jgi:glycosyltransferase involved in cell wall biosynthesis